MPHTGAYIRPTETFSILPTEIQPDWWPKKLNMPLTLVPTKSPRQSPPKYKTTLLIAPTTVIHLDLDTPLSVDTSAGIDHVWRFILSYKSS